MNHDILIRNGSVVDGTGAPGRLADVAVRGDRITVVGDIPSSNSAHVIDATDLIVAPGFIDIHTHSDVTVLLDPRCESKILQGVTTEVTGNCSFSPFPFAKEHMELHRDHLLRIGDGVPSLSWFDLDGYAKEVAASGPALNVAPLVGHGTIRVAVLGVEQRAPTHDELNQMKSLLAQSLEQGAFGMTTGLTHVPSAYGSEAEVTELVSVVAAHGALYATHSRGGSAGPFGGTEEAIRTATAAGARLQASHAAINHPDRWGRAADMLALIEEARDGGLDVALDVYPYDASSSSLTQYLPPWVQDGGTEAMRARLTDPAALEKAERDLAAGWFGGIPWLWDRVVFDRIGPGYEQYTGLSIEEAARRAQVTPAAFTLQVCLTHGNYPRVVLFYRTEEDMMTFLSHPSAVVGSDGSALPLAQGAKRPHPRSFGTYPRILGRYVRDKGLLTLAEAVRKTSGAVADRLQLTDRGYIRTGFAADIVVFDPDTIADRATFEDPAQAPIGVEYVLVNGEVAVDGGAQTVARAGRAAPGDEFDEERRAMMDVILRGGTVIDGSGSPGRREDVGISDGHLVALEPDLGTAADRVIDVTGMVVTPGFIDIHTHSDLTALRDPACESKVRQGVTTDVTGNCGLSPYPITSEFREAHLDLLEGRGIGENGLELTWSDIDGYAEVAAKRRPAFNIAPLVGHSNLRTAGMGLAQRTPTPEELATMQGLLDEQLRQGAFGFSTGLTLVPGAYATEEEVVALVGVVAKHDALYATHTRGDGKREFGGVEEAIRAATATGARLQYSHAAINIPALWGRASDVTSIIEEARSGGLDVMFDVYPYAASSSAMTQYLPTWVQEGGPEAMRARLSDPAVYERALNELRAGWFGGIPWYWSRVMLSKVDQPDAWSVGLSIEEAATKVGADPAEWALQLCLDHGNTARVVLFYRTEEDMSTFLAHPLSMVGSDGSAIPFDTGAEQPHPRSFGTYPRIFGRYVREQGVLTLEDAVRKSTSAVAERLRISDRGVLREGLVADVAVFDPDTIIDGATFSEPATPPVGVHHVLVNGELVIDGGDQTDARPGRVLRRPGSRRAAD